MRIGCPDLEPSQILLSIPFSFGPWKARDLCTCRCSWRKRSTKNCGVKTGERTGRSARTRSDWDCWRQTSLRWRCRTWWGCWATSRSWTRQKLRPRFALRWPSKLLSLTFSLIQVSPVLHSSLEWKCIIAHLCLLTGGRRTTRQQIRRESWLLHRKRRKVQGSWRRMSPPASMWRSTGDRNSRFQIPDPKTGQEKKILNPFH